MKSNRIILLFATLLSVSAARSQKNIVLEQLHYATPLNYLEANGLEQVLAGYLNTALVNFHHGRLTDTGSLHLTDNTNRRRIEFSQADTSQLHLLMDIAEYAPATFYAAQGLQRLTAADSAMRKTIVTVFRVSATLLDHNREIVFRNQVDVFISHTRGGGIGPRSPFLQVMPKSFVEIMRKTFDYLLDPENELTEVGMAVPGVYSTDNFYMTVLPGKQRIYVKTNKNIHSFTYDTTQFLRQGDALYYELQLKGKKAEKYPARIMQAIEQAPGRSRSAFVFLRQEWRDVLKDRNYTVQCLVQVDPEQMFGLHNFMPGDIHFLIADKDTSAIFNISRNITDSRNKLYPGRVYNGIDSSTAVSISDLQPTWPLVYNYVIKGTLMQKSFEIRCSGPGNALKEMYINDKLVCIAQGSDSPDTFVVFDASLPAETLNQLLMIGFNRFLE